MRNKYSGLMIAICAFLMITFIFSADSFAARKRIVFGGGPAGGTFQIVANAVQVYDPVKALEGYNVQAQSSAGSTENLRKVNAGKSHFGVVYSGEVYQARNGKLTGDPNKYEDVMAVAYLYGAPAQLVVRAGSGVIVQRIWKERKSAWATRGPGHSPTASFSLNISESGKKSNGMPWDMMTQPMLSAITS
jgi:hypothetical protein